ncbi:MAG: LysM peptidoglycan-binding domain-containing protein [Acidimicrobiia bacterium]
MARLSIRVSFLALVVTGTLAADALPGQTAVRLPVTIVQSPSSVVVEPGDHLWKISASRLGGELGRDASDGEVWPYWRAVIEANVSRLRSGDPDLIYPGEVIELPSP